MVESSALALSYRTVLCAISERIPWSGKRAAHPLHAKQSRMEVVHHMQCIVCTVQYGCSASYVVYHMYSTICSEIGVVLLSARKAAHQPEYHQFLTDLVEVCIAVFVTGNNVIGYFVVSSTNVG